MGQNLINVGTVANDRTGDTWRDAMIKVNTDVGQLFGSGGFTNVVYVNSPDDFPAAVSGVRELIPAGVTSITYVLGAAIIDMGTDRFTVTNGLVVLRGWHRVGSQIKSLTTGDLFTVTNGSYVTEFLLIDAVNAQVLNFSGGGIVDFVVFQNTVLVGCRRWGTIAGAVTTSFRILNAPSTSEAGFLWTGTLNSEINITDTRLSGWTGTALDLGTATFNTIIMSSDTRLISPSGTTILSGLTANGNIKANGRAIIDGAFFNGTGTALNGIDTQDTLYRFTNCTFADNETINSRNLACIHLVGSPGGTVTINTANIFEEIGGTGFISTVNDRFTVSSSGVLTYIGEGNINLELFGRTTLEKDGGGVDVLFARLAKNWQPTDTSKTGDTNTDVNITNMSSIANLKPGVFVSGTDIPADTTIVSVGATDSIVISNAATGSTSTVSLTFHDKGVPQSGGQSANSTLTSIPLGTLFPASKNDNFRMIYANGSGTANIDVNVAAFEIGGGN